MKHVDAKPATEEDIARSLERYNRWENSTDGEDPAQIRKDLQQCMQNNFSVFREGQAMADGLEELKVIRERLKNAHLSDKSTEFNTQRIECLELEKPNGNSLRDGCSGKLPHRESWCTCSF
ncbi:hypothetical protein OH492_06145 [Vibrio chagasii]|nr:hypothetical protein [Vibrio chagasii]